MPYRSPSERLIASIHRYQENRDRPGLLARARCQLAKVGYRYWTTVTGSDIHRDATIASSVRLPHPNGVVIHRDAVVGDGCLIMQQVTLGQTHLEGAPTLGRDAYVGAGAKVLGKIRIGDRARIGANAVVLTDVPDDATAVGVPARVIPGAARAIGDTDAAAPTRA